MITDPDILRFAKAQIDRQGEDAPLWAARQARAMLESGNSGGERLGHGLHEPTLCSEKSDVTRPSVCPQVGGGGLPRPTHLCVGVRG